MPIAVPEIKGDDGQNFPLWRHPNPLKTNLVRFQSHIETKYNVKFEGYEGFRQWSIQNLDDFWSEVYRWTGVKASTAFTKVLPLPSSGT
jgi:acetoacetyl-CoA synthetase